jgi:hypothetical protein
MKKLLKWKALLLGCSIMLVSAGFVSCKKTENPIKFPMGEFPDTSLSFTDLNSSYDDYNVAIYKLYGDLIIVFSSNRGSSGGQFDLVQGEITFIFDQTNGKFEYGSEIINDAFITKLLKASNTSGNDFGPYRLFSSVDGYEYLILSSVNSSGNLDFYYLKNMPAFGTNLPGVFGPYPVNLLNTSSDDAYMCFDTNQDTLYFSTKTGGNFDIYLKKKPVETDLTTWFNSSYSASLPIDSINSSSDDKCPIVNSNVMVFASNRPGGLGGYDLYYSVFKNGKWGYPKNFGPDVNTSSDEYRPVLATHQDFSNTLMIFSSNRPGGKGGFDLYFRGVSLTKD